MKLAVAVITGESMRTGFVMSLMAYLRRHPDTELLIGQGGPQLYATRNQLTRIFLATEAEALLMLDTDIVFDEQHVDKLVAGIKDGNEIVSGVYAEPTGELVIGGAGFMAVTRKAFEELKEDWFNHVERPDAPEPEERQWAEDKSFFVRADLAGIATLIDRENRVGHLKVVVV